MSNTVSVTLRAFRDSDGSEVRPGDTIADFRGDTAIFAGATRAPDGHRTGRVTVAGGCEYYMTVYGLTVRAVAGWHGELMTEGGPWQQLVPPLRDFIPFETSWHLRGVRTVPDGSTRTGGLAAEYVTSAMLAYYVVYRFETPVAWHLPPGYPSHDSPAQWVFPALRASHRAFPDQQALRSAAAAITPASR